MKETNIHTKTITNKSWNQIEGRFDHSFVFAFKNKAEYLKFRCSWKANYGALSQSIRELKVSIRTIMRRNEYAGKQQSELYVRKSDATVQLHMLKAAKVEACRQYSAAKAIAK
jgi:hypothetical protein